MISFTTGIRYLNRQIVAVLGFEIDLRINAPQFHVDAGNFGRVQSIIVGNELTNTALEIEAFIGAAIAIMENRVLGDAAESDIAAMSTHRIADFNRADFFAVYITCERPTRAIIDRGDAVRLTGFNVDRNRLEFPTGALAPSAHVKLAIINVEVEAVDRAAFFINDLARLNIVASFNC